MHIVYSLRHATAGAGGGAVFDFVIGPGAAGWFRHDFDHSGAYAGVSPSGMEDIGARLRGSPSMVLELRAAAVAMEVAACGLLEVAESAARGGEPENADRLAMRAREVEQERRLALDEVVAARRAAGGPRRCDARQLSQPRRSQQ